MPDFVPAPIKLTVGVAALEALDIRIGTIERVEEIPRSDKLMKLTVNSATIRARSSRVSRKSVPIRAKLRAVKRWSS